MRKFKVIRGTVKVTNEVEFDAGDSFDEEDLYCMEAHKRDRRIRVMLELGTIKEEFTNEFPIAIGGPWYQLSNGSKARGLAEAIRLQGALTD